MGKSNRVLLAGVCLFAMQVQAQAQSARPGSNEGKVAGSRSDGQIRFNIPPGTLQFAVDLWIHQSGRELIYVADDLSGIHTKGVRGLRYAPDALAELLQGTNLQAHSDSSGVLAIGRRKVALSDMDTTPEILVEGKRDGSLNLGIQRTRNDSQPFIVLTSEEIKRSGAPDLETFLRNQLTVNNTAGTAAQAGRDSLTGRASRGISEVNLRGLGGRETLILIDGRRQPGANVGTGELGQTQIAGIPLAAIERIEVLASSASAMYGSGASGGVINIVLKQSYRGGEITATYGNTGDFKQADSRIDATFSTTFEGGRTNVNLAASWRKAQPLFYRDRAYIYERNLAESLQQTNGDAGLLFGGAPPVGNLPNFLSAGRRPLQLKPQYGGTRFNSFFGFVPADFQGVATGDISRLTANIGKYDLTLAPGTQQGGLDSPLIYGNEMANAILTVRRDMNDWLKLYVRGQVGRTVSQSFYTAGYTDATLSSRSPFNPFTNTIYLTFPSTGPNYTLNNRGTTWNATGGGTIKLPYEWLANVDVSYGKFVNEVADRPKAVSVLFGQRINAGQIDLLRDLVRYPLDYQFAANSEVQNAPLDSTTLNTSVRASGPLPIKLPGGKVQLALTMERSSNVLGAAAGAGSLGFASIGDYRQRGVYTLQSQFGEITFPLIDPSNDVPLVRLFDIRVSARREHYTAVGGDSIRCFTISGDIPVDWRSLCPPPGLPDSRSRSSRQNIDPMVSGRWSPIADVMFRASYGTGYLPPTLAQLTKLPGSIAITAFDPLRGNEPVGVPDGSGDYLVDGFTGGNPDVAPERSRTVTAGVILTPRLIPNLRFSADWTRIMKTNNFYDPLGLTNAGSAPTPELALLKNQIFAQFLKFYPDRVKRGPASDGYAVGPITSLDLSLSNYVGTTVEAVDFQLDYWHDLFGGRLDLSASATWNRELRVELYPGDVADYVGVSGGVGSITGGTSALRWRGNGIVRWSRDALSVGLQTIYFDGYYLSTAHSVVPAQGAARIPAQVYNNLMLSYAFDSGITFRLNIINLTDKTPPRDATVPPLYYSRYGDPRGRNFLASITKSF